MRCRVILAVAALAFSQASWANGPETWLKRMTESHRTLNYQGVVTYQVDDRLSSFKVSHVVKDGREYESLEALSHGEHEVIRQGHDISCVHPGPELLHLLAGDSPEAKQLQKLYHLSLRESGSVAGRAAIGLSIQPKDVYRLGYRLALDKETGLLLRSEIVNKRGKVLERFEYVVLDLSFDEAALERDESQLIAHPPVGEQGSVPEVNWRVSWLPDGFTPLAVRDQAPSISYTDGLAVFTVFVESTEGAASQSDSHMRRGASVSYSTTHKSRGVRVSVVGEIPMLTARQVALGVEWPE
ncbi:MAG: MucB/RseB C-terminal domain-containing protein [Spongiibacter marinus]|uniref:MucB/RseB C-terminal domain-containing protein n=1 Tax=Spongiibacter marinus TaxID=354246 RepID=UPI003C4FE847